MAHKRRKPVVELAGGRALRTTPVYDTYWRFAAARQDVFARRARGDDRPWTSDPIISTHRFTNAYRASDRVSQYLIRRVIYEGSQDAEEVFFRTLLFKIFNRIDTWELLLDHFREPPTWKSFKPDRYAQVFDSAMARRRRLYCASYIMPSPNFGHTRKHRNHLDLLDYIMRDGAARHVGSAQSLQRVFEILRGYPSLGDFLAFQFAIDLNYSELIDFSEMEFVVAGPGARDGIRKCFEDTGGLTESEIIRHVARVADEEFARRGLSFQKLGGKRPLQLVDCQNLFCETDKYARVAHPNVTVRSGRTRIKQRFVPNACPPPPEFYPPKWGLLHANPAARRAHASRQPSLAFIEGAERT